MSFQGLQDNLRRTLWRRIEAGELTGLRLAEQAGFKQAHISNFLNGKRGLSLEGMDRVLRVQRLSVLDLLSPSELEKRAPLVFPADDEFESVVLVEGGAAASQPLIASASGKEILKFRRSFLRKLRPQADASRRHWQRFVALRADARDGMRMYPRLLPGATILLDRHYNSLKPYRKGELNMYAVRRQRGCRVSYVELAGQQLVLRPHNQAYAIESMPIARGNTVADYVVGRICYVGFET